MSLNLQQIATRIDKLAKSNSVSYPLAEKVVDINLALDRAIFLILQAEGRWQFDDTNHAGYPEIFTNIVSGTRRYAFTADGTGNLILEIYKVFVMDQNGVYQEACPSDVQTQDGTESFTDGRNTAGFPYRYDKTGKWIDLDPVPDYNAVNGIKLLVNREASYFTTADTTKVPGIAGIFHEYLALRPAYFKALIDNPAMAGGLGSEMLQMEKDIQAHYSRRAKDQRARLGQRITRFK